MATKRKNIKQPEVRVRTTYHEAINNKREGYRVPAEFHCEPIGITLYGNVLGRGTTEFDAIKDFERRVKDESGNSIKAVKADHPDTSVEASHKPAPPKSIADQLRALTHRADDLYWIVFLAEKGVAAMRQEFKTQPGGFGASEIASLASWQADLEQLVKRIESTFPPKKGGAG